MSSLFRQSSFFSKEFRYPVERQVGFWKSDSDHMRFSSTDALFSQSIETSNFHIEEEEPFESLKEIEAQTIGDLLPDDDDLLSGVIDDFQFHAQRNAVDDKDDFDIFSSGGGLELEVEDGFNCYGGNKSSELYWGIPNDHHSGSISPFAGEHPYGEHPSRTLFVRNINSNVEDSELKVLFEQYGDIRTLYTSCKHRGFVMISYYDTRAACNAMKALQNKPLRRRKLDIHFSIPKGNPSEKDITQGTLVAFNLDSSISNDDLHQIFGVYGEIKEIREPPHKHHHKFIEFYDVRAAEAALNDVNRSNIVGKQIKVGPSCPGGSRRLMQQLSPDLEQEEASGIQQLGSLPDNSQSGCYGPVSLGEIASSGLDNGAVQGLHSAVRSPVSSLVETTFHGISSSLPRSLSSPVRMASIGSHSNQMSLREPSHSLSHMKFGFQDMPTFHPHSLLEYHHEGLTNSVAYSSLGGMSAMAASTSFVPAEGIDNMHLPRVSSGGLSSHSFELNDGVFGASGNGSCLLQGSQYVPSKSNLYRSNSSSMTMWTNSTSFVSGVRSLSPHQMCGLSGTPSHMLSTVLPLNHHHVGSAPAVNPSLLDRRHAFGGNAPNASFHMGSLGSMGFTSNSTSHPLELTSRNIFPRVGANGLSPSMSAPDLGMSSSQQKCNIIPGRNSMIPMPCSHDAPNGRVRSRKNEANSNQTDNKKLYELVIDHILHREDTRTTLMIKNIPNKYTSKMLLAAIDEKHRGTYDFIYLPIDFKNKCNVGYAFINLTDPMNIIPFFQSFNGKKWKKFNSEKVASLAYARIQGKAALIAHFQNSSLMNEDKRCRPILFHSSGPNAGEPEPFQMGTNICPRPSKTQTSSNEDNHHGSPAASVSGEDGLDSSSGSTKSIKQ